MNMFNLGDGFILQTNAEKSDVEQAVKIVKTLLPEDYTTDDLEKTLGIHGFVTAIWNSNEDSKIDW